MGTIHIEINTDNVAFDDPASEVARILRALASDVDRGSFDHGFGPSALLDINGNRVGTIYAS